MAIATHAKSVANLAELDADFQAATHFDISRVRQLYERLVQAGLRDAGFDWQAEGWDPVRGATELDKLSNQLSDFERAQKDHGEFEAALRLQLAIDSRIARLMLCTDDAELRNDVVERVRRCLGEESDAEIVDIWTQVLVQFQGSSNEGGLSRESALIPPKFLEPATLAQMRRNIAVFVVWLQWRLRAEAVQRDGVRAFPSGVPGVGSILASRASLVRPIGEQRLAVCLARICATLRLDARERFCQAAGLAPDGWIASSVQRNKSLQAKAAADDANDKLLLRLLDRLSLYLAASAVMMATPLDRALSQHRLGLEVELPLGRNEVLGKKEIDLQRRLCRFLLERGIYAVGTKFGRSEIDLLTSSAPATYVLEVKLYKKAPTPAQIRQNLAQLQVYMGQQPIAPRGVLLIYNLSGRQIVADPILRISPMAITRNA